MITLLENAFIVSIIGMAKNVGKTTTLNFLLKKLYGKKKIGLTSIGRDGELLDVVTFLPKPRIYIECGTIVATTTLCLQQSDFTKQVLESTGITTPLGEVVVVKALSDGYVDLAGPSIIKDMKKIITILKRYEVDFILIDGALSRKGFASSEICDHTILCTGFSYSNQINHILQDTLHVVSLFQLKIIDDHLNDRFKHLIKTSNISLIYKNGKDKQLPFKTILNKGKLLIHELTKDVRYLIISGALTDEFLNLLLKNRKLSSPLTIVVKHPMKCIYQSSLNEVLLKTNIDIKVLSQTKLLCVTINPMSREGLMYDEEAFIKALKQKIDVPIFNVMRDNCE